MVYLLALVACLATILAGSESALPSIEGPAKGDADSKPVRKTIPDIAVSEWI
jgi:hypothetical protein